MCPVTKVLWGAYAFRRMSSDREPGCLGRMWFSVGRHMHPKCKSFIWYKPTFSRYIYSPGCPSLGHNKFPVVIHKKNTIFQNSRRARLNLDGGMGRSGVRGPKVRPPRPYGPDSVPVEGTTVGRTDLNERECPIVLPYSWLLYATRGPCNYDPSEV